MKRNRSKTFELKSISILRFAFLPWDWQACTLKVYSLKLLGLNDILEYSFNISMVCDSFADENYPRKYKRGNLYKEMLNLVRLSMMPAETLN